MPTSVAVIVPTFNRAAFLPEALESLLAQKRPADEIIVVDDGSTDATPDVCAAYGSAIRYLRKENGGRATAINAGLALVEADWVWCLDDDDIAPPDAIEAYARAVEKDPGLDFLYAGYARFRDGDAGRNIGRPLLPPDIAGRDVFLALLLENYFHPPTIFARTSSLRALRGFDATFIRSQDYDLALRLAYGYRGAAVRHVTLLFREHEGVRGTLGNPIAAAGRHPAWRKFDQIIFRRLHAELPLEAYASVSGEAGRREALLRRATAMARNGLIEEAVADFARLAEHESARPARAGLTPEEKSICRRTFVPRNEISAANGTREVREILRRGLSAPGTGHIRYAMAKGVYYQLLASLRRKRWPEAWHLTVRLAMACASWPTLRAALARAPRHA